MKKKYIQQVQQLNFHKNLGYFRFGDVAGKKLLTNEAGEFVMLEKKQWQKFIQDAEVGDIFLQKELIEKGFLKRETDETGMAIKFSQKKRFLFTGPSLHVFVVTLRCDNKCVYCHASAQCMEKEGVDMSIETATKALEIAFKSPNNFIAIEFQGGEPLANWKVVKFVIEQAIKKAKKTNKKLDLRLVSNFNLMTQEKFEYLIKNNVSLCTSLDGPAEIHDSNRIHNAEGNHRNVVYWIEKFRKSKALREKYGYKKNIHAIPTFTRQSLGNHKAIIDEYLKLGFKEIFIKPMNPFGFSKSSWSRIGYSTEEFYKFYVKSLEYILELNKNSIEISENTAKYYLQKILTNSDPNYFESRCPCGAGIGQLAYNHNGNIYTCDEGRMFSEMGDESFQIGTVNSRYKELLDNSIVKSMCSASCLVGAPGCDSCAYLPYCGTCPIYNYAEQDNIYGQMPTNERCVLSKLTLDYIFKLLQNKDGKKIFNDWVINSTNNEQKTATIKKRS